MFFFGQNFTLKTIVHILIKSKLSALLENSFIEKNKSGKQFSIFFRHFVEIPKHSLLYFRKKNEDCDAFCIGEY